MPRLPFLGINVDERFLAHRLRSTSVGGMAGALVAGGLFFYRYVHDQRLETDLVAVVLAMVVVKFALLAYYRLTD